MTIFALLICKKVIWQIFWVHNRKVLTSNVFFVCNQLCNLNDDLKDIGVFIYQRSSFDPKETFNQHNTKTLQKPRFFLRFLLSRVPKKNKTNPLRVSSTSPFCFGCQKQPLGPWKNHGLVSRETFLPHVFPIQTSVVQVDGGITVKTAALAAMAGANEVVAGSAIFGASNLRRSIRHGIKTRFWGEKQRVGGGLGC